MSYVGMVRSMRQQSPLMLGIGGEGLLQLEFISRGVSLAPLRAANLRQRDN